MVPLLVEACPSFAHKWEIHKKEYYGEENFLPYVALMEFCVHVVELYKAGRTQEFDEIFNVVERLHLDGDDYVREATTIGFLEGLQNRSENIGNGKADFPKFLLPESAKWWEQLNLFWDGKISYVGETIER